MASRIFPRSYSSTASAPGQASGTSTTGQPMIGFHAVQVKGNSTVADLQTQATNEWAWLPIPPDGISTSYKQGWDTASQDWKGAAAMAGVNMGAAFLGGTEEKGEGNEALVKASTVSGLMDLVKEAGKSALGLGVGISTRALEQSYISYSGPGYRSHSFSFQLRPESEADSDEIDKIVSFFKFYAAPVLGDTGGLARLYDVPHLFHIELLPGTGMMKYKQAALTNIDVKYGGEKFNTFSKGGRPIQTDLSLSFQEMQLLSQIDFGDH